MKKKKVLFAATVYSHLAAFHKPFIKMLQDKGYEVHAAANPDHGRKEEIEKMGVICWDISFSRSPYRLANLMAIRELIKLLSNHYFELIHVHTPIASFLVRYVAKKCRQGSVLYTAHGFHFYEGAPLQNWLIYYTAEKIASRWTDGLIVMNEEDYKNGKRLGFRENESLFFTHGVGVSFDQYSVSPDSSCYVREQLNIANNDIVITCIAELIERKNHIYLLRNWKNILNRYPNVHCLIVGTGRKEDDLKKYVEQNKLRNIHFLGFREDIPEILSQSDIITLLSLHEGLPRCIMEAMVSGKPLVVTNVRGSRDLVKHGANGFVVDLEDDQSLVESFVKLINDKDLREKMGQASLKEIQSYNLAHVLNEMRDIYSRYIEC
ncbi:MULTISPECIES: glycosyltransferase family 4 protein [unclassified Geobacillus]|uniref:glycosyltransferase family 4 protein n=1 Tax=unclassified Geobacillus TaxID=2642459 RepID=UPI000BE3203D|nr:MULTISPECIES: glycosyltransferase family 4 protein [unclassified Geobacillus]PDM39060.1 glycosyltransferase family 1 protein [Parageobacillus yumthangensis]PUF87818.1 glycosyltransferase family 1 protein [Geobacillus sp. LYN3]RDV22545.1 glycosyltransferase family 1 protein [Parageobacillus toebii]TXK87436.1 glycosyltransferase family 4 protein [Geobacillus sp. AYS3]